MGSCFILLAALAFPATAFAIMTVLSTLVLLNVVAASLSFAFTSAFTAIKAARRRGCDKGTHPSPPQARRCRSSDSAAPAQLVSLSAHDFHELYSRCEAKRSCCPIARPAIPAKRGKVSLRSSADAYLVSVAVTGLRVDEAGAVVVNAHAGSERLGVAPRVSIGGTTDAVQVDRTISLPADANVEKAVVTIEAQGALTIEVPRMRRLIKISHGKPTGRSSASSPPNPSKASDDKTSQAVSRSASPLLRACEPDESNVQLPDEAYESGEDFCDEKKESDEETTVEGWEQVTLNE